MNLYQIVQTFRFYVDEPDQTFLTNTQVQYFLRTAYNEYYNTIQQYNDQWFTDVHTIPNFNTQVDLNVSPNNLMGSGTFDGPGRLTRLVSVMNIDGSSGTPTYYYTAASNLTDFANRSTLKWFLSGPTLIFNAPFQADISLGYSYFPDIDFTKIGPNDDERLNDNLDQFHDLISLMMAKLYYIKDMTSNPAMSQEIMTRKNDMISFLAQGMAFESNQYVSRTWRRGNGYGVQ